MEQQQERRIDFATRERIAVLETQMSAVAKQIGDMSQTLQRIEQTLAESKGSWKVLMLMGGGAATLGGLIVQWFHK